METSKGSLQGRWRGGATGGAPFIPTTQIDGLYARSSRDEMPEFKNNFLLLADCASVALNMKMFLEVPCERTVVANAVEGPRCVP